jgi:hypothetical protein
VAVTSPGSHTPAAAIVAALRAKGVRLWVENGELRYRAPKHTMTNDELLRLQAERQQIVALLDMAEHSSAVPALRPRSYGERVPLTYAQTTLWDSGRRLQRKPIRQIASATRLCGRLQVDLLRASVIEVQRRHEALRARIVLVDGKAVQDIAHETLCEMQLIDLSTLPAGAREQELRAAIRSLILEPFRFDVGPLLAVRLVKLRDAEHVLIVAIEHVISDAYSLNIVLRDLFAFYAGSFDLRMRPAAPVLIQHPDYAVWQQRVAAEWVAEHKEYWRRVLEYPAVRFPGAQDAMSGARSGWEITSARIREQLRDALRRWCQAQATTLAMSALVAYVAVVFRWCGVRKGVLRCITDGRVQPELRDAIGNFAAPMYLPVALTEGGSFLDLLAHLTHEYCEAYRHTDLYYLQSTMPKCEVMRTPIFNWIPQEPRLESTLLPGSPDMLTCSDVEFDNPVYESFAMDSDPILLLHDRSSYVALELLWPRSRFKAAAMERFVQSLLSTIHEMIERPERAIDDVALPIHG